MIIARYEKGQRFLDLVRYVARGLDDDGCAVDEECWTCEVYSNNESDYNDHRTFEFADETSARIFVNMNDWKEQVL